jgi:hypothetical protein
MTPTCTLGGWRFFLVNTDLVNALVNTSQKVPIPTHCLVRIVNVDSVVPAEHFTGRMSRNLHNDRFRDSGFPHVGVEGVTEVVKNKTSFFKSSAGYPGFLAGFDKTSFD